MGSRKVGKLTVGLSLLIIGVSLLLGNWLDFSLLKLLSYLWPVILIMLGIEYFYKRRQQEEEGEKVSFDSKAIIFIFFILLVSGGLFSLSGSNGLQFNFPFVDQWKNEVEIEERYNVADIDALSFQFTNGNIEIIGDDTDEIIIQGVIKSKENNKSKVLKLYEQERKIKEKRGTFQYTVTPSGSLFSQEKNFLVDIEILVPQDLFLEVEVINGILSGENLNKDVKFRTTNGMIEASHILGSVSARSTNGTINLEEIQGDVSATTTNGKVIVENVGGRLDVKATNGTITVDSEIVGGDWEASTTNGGIKLFIPADASVKIEGETSNGSVDGNLAWERKHSGSRKNKQGSAALNDGRYSIYAESVNGSVRINKD